ncbi:MAG TPA: hypothetical protein VLC06_21990 [Polyangia bacterium]|nr:hypothetical protein [Polyangia bacterium]
MLSFAIVCLLAQQIDQGALEKAMAADAAAKAATAPATTPGSTPAAAAGTPIPGVTPAAEGAPADATPGGGSWAAQQGARAPGGSLLNPALSFILDGSFGYYGAHTGDFAALGLPAAGDDPSVSRQGFALQEIELAAQSAIDPYFEGAIFLTIPNLEGLEVEEAYLVTTSLPLNLQIKAGTFRSQFGRNNTQHLHVQFFTRRPLMTALLFGEDGLRGPGAQVSVLLPLPWFATLYVESFSLTPPDDLAGVATFGGGVRLTPNNLTYTTELEQFFELAESHSLLVGLNFATGRSVDCPTAVACGPAPVEGPRSYFYGADVYYKWKPANVAQSYVSFQWTTEFYERTLADGGPTVGAGYSEAVVQIDRRFFLGGRFDLTGLPSGLDVPRRYGGAGSLTFTPSEFSRLRLYVQELGGPSVAATTVGFLQVEYAMGAHGAHPF